MEAMRDAKGVIDWDAYAALERAWERWDRRHGPYWRAKEGVPHQLDDLQFYTLLTGATTRNVHVAQDALAELQDELERLIAAKEPIPGPPDVERVRKRTERRRLKAILQAMPLEAQA
jgi:hypothetical protein